MYKKMSALLYMLSAPLQP